MRVYSVLNSDIYFKFVNFLPFFTKKFYQSGIFDYLTIFTATKIANFKSHYPPVDIFLGDTNIRPMRHFGTKSRFIKPYKSQQYFVSRTILKRLKLFKKNQISISHKNNIIAIATSKFKIGIDVEYIKNRNFLSVAKLCFNDFELSMCQNLYQFYQIFTIKEALLKLQNNGIYDILNVGFAAKNKEVVLFGKDDKRFEFLSFLLNDKYIVSIVF